MAKSNFLCKVSHSFQPGFNPDIKPNQCAVAAFNLCCSHCDNTFNLSFIEHKVTALTKKLPDLLYSAPQHKSPQKWHRLCCFYGLETQLHSNSNQTLSTNLCSSFDIVVVLLVSIDRITNVTESLILATSKRNVFIKTQ